MECGQYYTKGTTTYICCYHNEWQKMYLGGTWHQRLPRLNYHDSFMIALLEYINLYMRLARWLIRPCFIIFTDCCEAILQ